MWSLCWGAVVAAGVCLSVLEWSVLTVVVAVVLLALLALLTWPPLLARGGRLLRHEVEPAGPADPVGEASLAGVDPHRAAADEDVPSGAEVAGLGDHDLCRLWRSTFWRLRDPRTREELERVITLRAACLDEFERRDPAAIRSWLDSGARAADGPERFRGVPRDEPDDPGLPETG